MARTRIKICGIRDEEALFAASEAGADAVGFMFVPSSPRYITPDEAYALLMAMPPFLASVAVVADPTIDEFSDLEEACPTTYTQLHGSESEKLVKALGPDIIKVVKFGDPAISEELARWEAHDDVSAILVDGSTGGSGIALDWSQLALLTDHLTKPLILAGGLNAKNVGEAIRMIRPYCVDVSSGVERERGVKDAGLIEEFCDAVRRADLSIAGE